jgi:hypothetical protein
MPEVPKARTVIVLMMDEVEWKRRDVRERLFC